MEAELRRVSENASHLISDINEALSALEKYERTNELGDARAFIECLYAIYYSTAPSKCDIPENVATQLAGDQPVQIGRHCPFATAHQAILELGNTSIGHVAFKLVLAGRPDLYKPGGEYECPPLCAPDDIMEHLAVAVKAFKEVSPTYEELNQAQALREIELARALRNLPAVEYQTGSAVRTGKRGRPPRTKAEIQADERIANTKKLHSTYLECGRALGIPAEEVEYACDRHRKYLDKLKKRSTEN